MSSLIKLNEECLNNCIHDTSKLIEKKSKLVRTGKVRDVYETEDSKFILIASDKLSAFDRHLTTIPDKGNILNKISTWWFNKTKNLVPNHLLNSRDNYIRVEKTEVIPIEFVVRSYMTGSTNTSIWKNYEKGSRMYCGHHLPDGLVKNQELPQILLTPTTKDEHDELISKEVIIEDKIMTLKQWETCKTYAYSLFQYGQELALKNGLILVDTKYEFGMDEDGKIILVDELHTPDSSRYWFNNSYDERMLEGEEPESIDKEIIRKWIKKTYKNPYDLSMDINIPNDLRLNLSQKYLQLYNLITNEHIQQN